jgi:hypothetical protein
MKAIILPSERIYGKRFKDTDVNVLTIYDIYLGQGCDPNVKRERLKYRPIRGMIEDIVKLAKDAFSLRKKDRKWT